MPDAQNNVPSPKEPLTRHLLASGHVSLWTTDTKRRDVPNNMAVPAQQNLELIVQTAEHLESQGYSKEKALGILELWQKQKSGNKVHIEYEDVFDVDLISRFLRAMMKTR